MNTTPIIDFLNRVTAAFGITASVAVEETADGPRLNLTGEEAEILVRHRGEPIKALQHIVDVTREMTHGTFGALAVTGEKRSPAAPALPTVMEAGVPGYVVISWFGVMTPTGTPREIVMRLNSDIAQVMRSPDIRERLATDGAEPTFSTPEKFGEFIKAEIAKWTKVIRDAKINPE